MDDKDFLKCLTTIPHHTPAVKEKFQRSFPKIPAFSPPGAHRISGTTIYREEAAEWTTTRACRNGWAGSGAMWMTSFFPLRPSLYPARDNKRNCHRDTLLERDLLFGLPSRRHFPAWTDGSGQRLGCFPFCVRWRGCEVSASKTGHKNKGGGLESLFRAAVFCRECSSGAVFVHFSLQGSGFWI